MEWPSHESICVDDAQGDGNFYVKLTEVNTRRGQLEGWGLPTVVCRDFIDNLWLRFLRR